jgi:hypothetical protein
MVLKIIHSNNLIKQTYKIIIDLKRKILIINKIIITSTFKDFIIKDLHWDITKIKV